MKRLALLPLLLAGCGPSEGLPLGVAIQGLAADDLSQAQVAVLKRGTAYVCRDVTATCLRSRIARPDGTFSADLVEVRFEGGAQGRAARVPLDPAKVTGSAGQTLKLHVAAGTDYLIVVEVLNSANRVVASGCNTLGTVSSGENDPVQIDAVAKNPVPDCDPLID